MYSSFTPEVIKLWSVGHIQPAISFCMARELKVFTFLKGYLGKKKKKVYSTWLYDSQSQKHLLLSHSQKKFAGTYFPFIRTSNIFRKFADSIYILKENLIFRNFNKWFMEP